MVLQPVILCPHQPPETRSRPPTLLPPRAACRSHGLTPRQPPAPATLFSSSDVLCWECCVNRPIRTFRVWLSGLAPASVVARARHPPPWWLRVGTRLRGVS